MTKRMLIDAVHPEETRVIIANDDRIIDFDFVTMAKTQIKGNIFLAKITRVEPSLQAAFVEYGGGKQGFLPFSEIHPDYYQIPSADRQKLVEEQIAEAEAEEAEEEQLYEQQAKQQARSGRKPRFDETGELPSETESLEPETVTHALIESEMPSISSEPLVFDSEPAVILPEVPVEHLELAENNYDFNDLPADMSETALDSDAFDVAELPAPDEIDPTIEILGEDVQEEARRGRSFYRRYRIQEVIKRNQIILVQAIKEERGNKGASLTTYISLAGRYCVLMPNSPKGGGISRKITDNSNRKRLKDVASELKTHRGMSVIIRTAGIDQPTEEIKRDYEYLTKLWNQIREVTLGSTAPATVYEEGNIVKRSLRDLYTTDIREVVIEGDVAHKEATSFMEMLMPNQNGHIKLHRDSLPILAAYGIEEQLQAMTDPQVKLPSGGYVVIQQTEALISIDVNSGRSTTERNVEETALKTNLEAAAEVARQLRLRDLAGLIVIDFIDMNYGKNRRLVERAVKDALKQDRAKIQLGRISSFGLMELSRQRMRPSISEAQGTLCPHCKGTGFIQSVETVGIQIIRTLEREAASGEYTILRVSTYPDAALHLLNEKRALLQSIEDRYKVKVVILVDTALITGNFRLIKISHEGKESLHDDGRERNRRGNRKRGRRGGRTRGEGESSFGEDDSESNNDSSDNITEAPSDDADDDAAPREQGDRPRRERGRRGGRRRRGERGDRPVGEPREGDVHSPRESGVEGEEFIADGIEGDTPREQGDRPRRERGRRGGRGRNRGGRERRETSGESSEQAASENVVIESPQWRQPSAEAPSAPQAPIIIQSTSHAPTHTPAPDTSDDENRPKRKGWWSRVMES
ncbi:MAG: ribonuclease E/G [Alphaproteobacteria bacterium]|nr:ribonuclease E/G [Alphaproteobacteria bacterium]